MLDKVCSLKERLYTMRDNIYLLKFLVQHIVSSVNVLVLDPHLPTPWRRFVGVGKDRVELRAKVLDSALSLFAGIENTYFICYIP